ncbi:alpha-amylase family glycosyl hydrolase [Halorussus salilacus]|uniref:alpha-amylase family glycosyl hydrolase n=1 Tax=Halorussus salilacus TaxID=2953750 RepID=UPI00209FB579|nr:alpha-amylase family glycosyl hydrolase [Halorussus salilacus]USZ66962.1 alpha-amylase family glycosyl hydrolase [Halorussus salilacus]
MNLERRTLLKGLGLASIGWAGSNAAGAAQLGDLTYATQEPSGVGSAVDYTDDVIYQIITDRFENGNTGNDPDGDLASDDCSDLRKYCGGDWQGIIDRIEDGYLTEMGITALWISPPFENVTSADPDIGTSYHGYWARDFEDANESFGDMDTFEELVSVAHDNGIKVVMDFVPNHTSPSTEDGDMEDGVLYDDGERVASYSDDPDDYFHHNGGTDYSSYEGQIYRNLYNLADFDQQNSFIDRYLKDAIEAWLDRGIDGIRVDAVAHMAPKWQKTLMDTIYDHEPVFTFGEWFLGTGESSQRYYDFSNDSGMSLLDFRFGQSLRQVLREFDDDWEDFWDVLQETASEHDQVVDQVPFIDNHDMERFTVEDGEVNTDLALAVLLTSRGTPTVYYGTEQYLTGGNDPENRKPMPSFDRTTTAYEIIKTLAPLRRSNPALAYGGTRQRWVNSDVFFYEREFGDNVVLVGINRSEDTYDVSGLSTALPEGTYEDHLDGLLDGFETTVGSDGSIDTFSFGPKTVCVWEHTGDTTEPTLGHVGPTMGRPGHTVTLSGEGFGSSTGSVGFGSTDASVVSWSDTQIEAEVPSVAGGFYDITVTDADGVESDAFADFEVLSGEQVSVRFVAEDAETETGENVYVVGNVHELGDWDTDRAVGPFFNRVVHEYPDWYFDVNVPAGTDIEFKFVKIADDGSVTWESGSNRTYTTPADSTGEYVGEWRT